MDAFVSQVTIIGGGTTGWLAALMLQTRLNRGRRAARIKVSLIESSSIPAVGVGEGSLFGLMKEFENLGLDEGEFIRRCNATFKLGVRFVDWNLTDAGAPYTYTHPVSYGPAWLGGKNPLYHFLAFGPHAGRDQQTAVDSLDPIVEAIRLGRAPRSMTRPFFKGEFFNYAYHFDATRLAEYVREVAIRRGVEHVVDDVEDATVGEDGCVSHLKLRRNGLWPVELVLDCTGFRGQIISKILKEPFQSYGSQLLCDRAVPIQIPYQGGEEIPSCTSSTALSGGWVWRIPLYNRIGMGYVYSSAFKSDDDAIKELCGHINVDPEICQPRVIQMRIGRLRRAWVGNCIAVGLAGGFIEPLEATAIMTSVTTAFLLTHHFPTRPVPDIIRETFNREVDAIYDGVRDFITMHYYLGNRPEPFWRAARDPSVLSDALQRNLELWRHRVPGAGDLPRQRIFTEQSYGLNLAAKGFFRGLSLFHQDNASPVDWARLESHLERLRGRVRKLPSARELLEAFHRGGTGKSSEGDPGPERAQAAHRPVSAISAGDGGSVLP